MLIAVLWVDMTDDQTIVVSLPAALARRARAYLATSEGYDGLSELIGVALENQLELEGATGASATAAPSARPLSIALPALLKARTGPLATNGPRESVEPLFSLTNRLFPLKVAARVLANLENEATLHDFRVEASRAARALGQVLRADDGRAGRRGADRRWIALPVGADEDAALARFAEHFTLGVTAAGEPSGPLAQIVLAAVGESGPSLTPLGAELALAQNPVLDGRSDEGSLLSPEERNLFRQALRTNAGELHAILEFLRTVRKHGGRQADVDAALRHHHSSWSEAQAVAHRAAMVGRLRDLGCVWVEGRGPSARIRLAEGAESNWDEREAK
jgi:hypothetical protein